MEKNKGGLWIVFLRLDISVLVQEWTNHPVHSSIEDLCAYLCTYIVFTLTQQAYYRPVVLSRPNAATP